MGPLLYMRSVVDRNVVMQRMTVFHSVVQVSIRLVAACGLDPPESPLMRFS